MIQHRHIPPLARMTAEQVRTQQKLPGYGREIAANMSRLEKAFRSAMAPDIPSYDVHSVQGADFSEWTYTEGLGCFHCSTQSMEINARLMLEASTWDGPIDVDYSDQIARKTKDKWSLQDVSESEQGVKVFFPPGGNLAFMVSVDNVRRAFSNDPAWRIKPHPVTTPPDLRHFLLQYGAQRVYSHEASGMAILRAADAVGYTTTSEMGIVAMLLDKPAQDFTLFENECAGRYHPIYLAIRRSSENVGSVINRIVNCPWSGMVPLTMTSKKATERFVAYKEKTLALREMYAPLTHRPNYPAPPSNGSK